MLFNGEERFILIPGYKIAAKEWGNPEGLPILAMHGWIDNAASFDFLAPLLPEYHIIAIDSPGCGHSSHRGEGTTPSILDEVFFTLQIAKALKWDKFSLMGHSRGGVIAQLIAAGAPEKIHALILIDIIGMIPGDLVENLRNSIRNFIDRPIRLATLYPDLDTAIRGRMMSSAFKYESSKALTLRGTEPVKGGYQWTFDRRELSFTSPIRYNIDMIKALLLGIECPTCVIFGEEGILKGNAYAMDAAMTIKNHFIHTIPGNHHLHMDNPEPVAKIIREFLNSFN
jgi:pimeloyl-ACP methyl ester carboxylesterase